MADSDFSWLALPCDIAPFVPHQQPMCLLERLLDVGAEHLRAEVTPRADDLFAHAAGVPGWVGLEWLAQAIAAWAGVHRAAGGEQPMIGFLLGTRRYQCARPYFTFGQPIRVDIFLDFRTDNGLGAFRGKLLDSDNQVVANAMLNVFQPASDDALAAMKNGDMA